MTIPPCPTCRGEAGHYVDVPTGDNWDPCPSCAAMPWLPCPYPTVRTGTDGERGCTGRHHNPAFNCHGSGRFKPDPETVTLWCFTHRCVVQDGSNKCDSWRVMMDDSLPCDIGWIVRPEQLEVAE